MHGRSAFYQSGGAFGYRDQLQDSLALIDVRVLDHFIVGDGEPYSFAARGML
jgi:DNA repair protein RadC